MRTALMVLALLAAPAFASQAVWKWVDEKGVTHYADRPVPGATKVEISVGSRADSVAAPPAPSSSSDQQAPAGPVYRDLEIWKPADKAVIVNTGGTIEVSLRVNPALQRNHYLYLYWNGKLVEGFPENALDYTLRDVPRGLHTLLAVIQDTQGNRVQESATVRFDVRQTSIAQPPVGPAVRPPPTPKPRGQSANKLPTMQPSYASLNGQRQPIDPRTNLPVKTKK